MFINGIEGWNYWNWIFYIQAEAEMDDLTMHQQQQQDLERQKLVSAMAAGRHAATLNL